MNDNNTVPLAHVPVDIFIRGILESFGNYAIENIRIEGNRLLGDVGVYNIFTSELCEWKDRLIRIRYEYFRVRKNLSDDYLRNIALLLALKNTCESFHTHHWLLDDYSSYIKTIPALTSEAYHETCWNVLDEFGKTFHDYYKSIEPRINADTHLMQCDYERVRYVVPYQIQAFTSEAAVPLIAETKEVLLSRHMSDSGFVIALGYAPEINTIYWNK